MSGFWWLLSLYLFLAALAFVLLPARLAAVTSYLGGWLLLPVGTYPASLHGFAFEIIGGMLPASNMLVTKAWIAPVATLVLASLRRPSVITGWRPGWIDLPMLLWCLWPLVSGWAAADPDPAPPLATAYLAGAWGAPWLLGRLLFADADGRTQLVAWTATAGLMLVPFALAEWLHGPFVYQLLYGFHPFVGDGATRYVGFRPLLLTENGNQYGITIAMAALCGIAAWRERPSRFTLARAAILVGAALLSQSVGSILLLAAGVPVIWHAVSTRALRRGAFAVALLAAVALPVYLSGVVPVERAVRDTPAGQRLLALVRATGRGSIGWRVSQDLKVRPLLAAHPIAGTARWDWWRPAGTRPWGLALLIAGQFGLVGLMLAGWSFALPFGRSVTAREPSDLDALTLATVALLSAADALLNAFVFAPALLMAGAAAAGRRP